MSEEKQEELELEVNEQEDGSVTIDNLPEEEEQPEVVEEESNEEPEQASEENEETDDSDSHDNETEDDTESEDTDEDRERIREARRKERKLKKEIAKKREVSAKNKISSLERQNAQLAERLASLENTSSSLQMSQIDKAVDDAEARVEFAKVQMMEASKAQDAEKQVEWMEAFADAKQKAAELKAYKENYAKNASRPRQNVPDPSAVKVQQKAQAWVSKNAWYDPAGSDTDSRIAKVIDNEMASEGWDPADDDYWDELDNRLSDRLPHHYTRPGDVKKAAEKSKATPKPKGPTAGTRTTQSAAKPNTITLSRERVQAIKDAGAWNDPQRRAKMIKAYAAYDKMNKGA